MARVVEAKNTATNLQPEPLRLSRIPTAMPSSNISTRRSLRRRPNNNP